MLHKRTSMTATFFKAEEKVLYELLLMLLKVISYVRYLIHRKS